MCRVHIHLVSSSCYLQIKWIFRNQYNIWHVWIEIEWSLKRGRHQAQGKVNNIDGKWERQGHGDAQEWSHEKITSNFMFAFYFLWFEALWRFMQDSNIIWSRFAKLSKFPNITLLISGKAVVQTHVCYISKAELVTLHTSLCYFSCDVAPVKF